MKEPPDEERQAWAIYVQGRLAVAGLLLGFGVILVFALIQGIRFGFGHRDYLLLACGAVFSFACCVAYNRMGVLRAKGSPKRSWMFLAIWCGPLPYLFIAYIVFYRGVWSLIRLFSKFSIESLCSALAFIFVGAFIIRDFAKLTDVARYHNQRAREMDAKLSPPRDSS